MIMVTSPSISLTSDRDQDAPHCGPTAAHDLAARNADCWPSLVAHMDRVAGLFTNGTFTTGGPVTRVGWWGQRDPGLPTSGVGRAG